MICNDSLFQYVKCLLFIRIFLKSYEHRLSLFGYKVFLIMPVDFVPKHNRDNAKGSFERGCRICKRRRGVIRSYGLNICRRCFRERADVLGFKKYD